MDLFRTSDNSEHHLLYIMMNFIKKQLEEAIIPHVSKSDTMSKSDTAAVSVKNRRNLKFRVELSKGNGHIS